MKHQTGQVAVVPEPDRWILRLSGALGTPDAAELHQAAIEVSRTGNPVYIDWTGLDQMDSSIAQVLLALRIELSGRDQPLLASSPTVSVEGYLRTAGLACLLEGAPGQ